VAWLSQTTGKTYRLLSEAEWEYAARAGTRTAYHWGDRFDDTKANIVGQTVPAGQYPANAFGLHDMIGNVWEWVEDCYVDNYLNVPSDGRKAPDTDGCSRVLRGGAWGNDPLFLRAAVRDRNQPVYRNGFSGFRVARSVSR
jgi:formylglycine-generating enzyme required for sulfatase activity